MTFPVLELRVALTGADFERLLRFYTTGLGLEVSADWSSERGRVMLVEMGRATLEIFDEAQADYVDDIEVGRRVSGKIRLALEVADLQTAIDRLVANGAKLVHPPVVTPWGDTNARLEDPEGIQVTLFQSTDR